MLGADMVAQGFIQRRAGEGLLERRQALRDRRAGADRDARRGLV